MTKYKGFIIDRGQHTSEIREWDGHTTSGTGCYETKYYVKAINPKTLKYYIFDNEQEACKQIDQYLTPQAAKRYTVERDKAKEKAKILEAKVEKFQAKINELKKEISGLESKIRTLNCNPASHAFNS